MTSASSSRIYIANFSLLEAVLAGLWEERNRALWALWISILSVGIALASLLVAILR